MVRSVFYSFHYKPDVYRVSQVRNIGALEANKSAHDNDWETVTKGGDKAIEKWIADQMHGRSCTVVLVGQNTAGRKWITHEIVKSWNEKMGVVGIHIHGLRNDESKISNKGGNPFAHINFVESGKRLSAIVQCYDPGGSNSKERYAWISRNLEAAVEEAIRVRKGN